MARPVISFRCDKFDHQNVAKALAWVEESTTAEQAISSEDAGCLIMEGFARCRGPKIPGSSGDITTGICQLVFEPAEIAVSGPADPPSVTLPEPPDINQHIEIRYGSF